VKVLVLYSPSPRSVLETALDLPPDATLGDALQQSGWLDLYPELRTNSLSTGIWGRRADLNAKLREGDRVEIYRPLRVDPKVARRERFVGQGAKSAGLFARRRPGSKAGY
jgi:putative ubiquitin-RnfH superfamily antitoxin RatB of RatAB toxin-antitoxin module